MRISYLWLWMLAGKQCVFLLSGSALTVTTVMFSRWCWPYYTFECIFFTLPVYYKKTVFVEGVLQNQELEGQILCQCKAAPFHGFLPLFQVWPYESSPVLLNIRKTKQHWKLGEKPEASIAIQFGGGQICLRMSVSKMEPVCTKLLFCV